jgi:PA14 domain
MMVVDGTDVILNRDTIAAPLNTTSRRRTDQPRSTETQLRQPNNKLMKTKFPPSRIRFLCTAFGLLALGAISARADLWDIPMLNGDGTLNTVCYTESGTWATSSAISSVAYSGTTTRGRSAIVNSAATTSTGFTAKCNTDTSDPSITTWRLWWPEPMTSESGNITVTITAGTGVTLDSHLSTGGVTPYPTSTGPTNGITYTWIRGGSGFTNFNNDVSHCALLCYFTNAANNAHPSLTFRWKSGTLSSSVRWTVDFLRWEKTSSCSSVANPTIQYPFKAGDTTVTVNGVDGSAIAIVIYANGVPIGNKTSGITAGANTVTVSALVKGQTIVATQIIGGTESCNNVGGVLVGTLNPAIKVALNLRNVHTPATAGYTGPIGTGGALGTAYSASDWYGMFLMPETQGAWLPPTGGAQVSPSTCWQTVTIDPKTAPYGNYWATTGGSGGPGANTAVTIQPFCALDGLFIEPTDETDIGPFQIYIANLANGATLIHDWNGEGCTPDAVSGGTQAATPGVQGLFEPVTYSSTSIGLQTPPPGSTLIACATNATSPNQALGGTNSQFINFAWNSTTAGKFLRLVAYGTYGNWPDYPQLDMSKPISFDILMLPGSANAAVSAVGAISFMDPVKICPGGALSLSVTAKGPGDPANYGQSIAKTFNYQWSFNGTAIADPGASGSVTVGPTDPPATISYTKAVVAGTDAGTYSVAVSDGTCTLTRTAVATIATTSIQLDYYGTDPGATLSAAAGQTFTLSVGASIPDPCACAQGLTYQWRKDGVAVASATDPSYGIPLDNASYAGHYSVAVTNPCTLAGFVTTNIQIAIQDTTPIQVPCSPSGLQGLYYTNRLYTAANTFGDPPAWTNNDQTVDFNYVSGSFNAGLFPDATDYFAVRWFGTFQPPFDNQLYTFTVRSDDGARLWVNGQLVVDSWITQGATDRTGTITLSAASPVDILLEYFENAVTASCQLSYSCASVYKSVIPTTQFCPGNVDTEIPPFVRIPASTVSLPNVTLTAAVTQYSAAVNKVELYDSLAGLLGTVTQSGSGNYSLTSWTPAPGVYHVYAKTFYGAASTINSPTNTLTVLPATPVPTYDPVCAGGTLQLHTPTVTGATYAWTNGTPYGFTSTLQEPARSPAVAGWYTNKVTVNGVTSLPGVVYVGVSNRPTAVVSGTAAVCEGSSTTISAALAGNGPWNVTWSDAVVQTGVAASPATRSVSPSTTTTYTVTALTDASCTAQAGDLTGSAVVTVNPIPAAPTAGSDSPVNVGGTLHLTASDITGATYAWTGPDSFSSSAQNPTIANVTTAAAGLYSVTATVNGCTSAAGTTTVQVNSAPAPTPVTITEILNNTDGTVTINYQGGTGGSFTLMRTTNPSLTRDAWTAVTPNQPATPGSFTITPVAGEFYAIRSN